MIPKVIHYCWFGHNPLPPLAEKCIASWRKFMPDYEIKEWNEDNFNVNIIPYTADAYKAKKYAFVSDFARFWIIYNYGGVYFDTDVEVIKPMDDILANGSYMGFERDTRTNIIGCVNPGLGFAANKGNELILKIIKYYNTLNFIIDPKLKKPKDTIVQHTTKILIENGLIAKQGIQDVNGIKIYPAEYFNPINTVTKRLRITGNTFTIHQYMASWTSKKPLFIRILRRLLPSWSLILLNRIKHPELY